MSDDGPTSTAHQPSGSTRFDRAEDLDEIALEKICYNKEVEIERLQLPESEPTTVAECGEAPIDERIAQIQFQCTGCDMREMVHYFGHSPPFVYGLRFTEHTYVMRDPYQPGPPRWKPKAEYFVALGANCKHCQSAVCKDTECSFYYAGTYCLQCAKLNVHCFSLEAQSKLRKQLAAKS